MMMMIRRTVLLVAALGLAAASASAQVKRNFPANALRGTIAVAQPPAATLNGAPVRLAPGVRIRGQGNLLATTGSFAGQSFIVNYVVDMQGQIKDIWVLTNEEIERLWPTTPEQAASWHFDAPTQTWTKP